MFWVVGVLVCLFLALIVRNRKVYNMSFKFKGNVGLVYYWEKDVWYLDKDIFNGRCYFYFIF